MGETRMRFVRSGASIILAATLTTGMVPLTALAQTDANDGAATAAAQADAGYYPVEGTEYTVPVTFTDAGNNMSAGFFEKTAKVVYQDGKYAVEITTNAPKYIGDITYDDNQTAEVVSTTDTAKTYRLTLSSLDAIDVTMVVVPMGNKAVSANIAFDTSSLPTEPSQPETPEQPGAGLEAGKTYSVPVSFQKEDGSASMSGNMLEPNATVIANEDGAYTVSLTVKKPDGFEFKGMTIGDDDAAMTLVTNEDGSLTFTGTVASISDRVKIGFAYSVPSFGDHNQIAYAVFDVKNATESETPNQPSKGDDVYATAAEQAVAGYKYTITTDQNPADGLYVRAEVPMSPHKYYVAYAKVADDGTVSWYKGEDYVAGTETDWNNAMGRQIGTTATVAANDDGSYTVVFPDASSMVTGLSSADAYATLADGKGAAAEQAVAGYKYTITTDQNPADGLYIRAEVPKSPTGGYVAYAKIADDGTVSWYKGEDYAAGTETDWNRAMGSVGSTATVAANDDGTYTIVFANASSLVTGLSFADNYEAANKGVEGEPEQPGETVDKSALASAIEAAKAIEQGNKSDDAWNELQTAIATAEAAYANDKIPQAGIDGVTAQLNAAVETFNNSEDVPSTPAGDAVETPDGFLMVAGQAYELPATYYKENTNETSMAGAYLADTAKVVYRDGVYSITLTVTDEGTQYLAGMSFGSGTAATKDGNTFTIQADSITSLINVGVTLDLSSMGMGTMDQTMQLALDTTSLKKADGTTGGQVTPPPTDNTNNNQNNTTTDNNNQATEQFQVGHTYQVPMAFLKHNSSETSMADQYFGDTALVRPQSDGTFKVSFSATSKGLEYIQGISYNGTALAQNGSEFTVSIPRVTTDTVLPMELTISAMSELNVGAQTADLHLYLSQAKDLGAGQDSLTANSAKTGALAQTSDSLPVAGIVGVAAVAAAAVAGAGVMARRRARDMK